MANKGGGSGGSSSAVKAGGAFVEIFSDDTKLVRGLKMAERRVLAFGKMTATMGAGLVGAGAGILGGLGAALSKTIDRGVDMGRLADKLGVSTEELSGFAYAAELAGQNLDEVQGHFENFSERVAQAALGAGEGAEAFNRLGIDPSKLMGMNSIQQMSALADAIQGVTNETERLGILSKLGGDKFQMLNTVLRNGSEGLRKYADEAKAVGYTVTADEAKRAMNAQLALNKVWFAAKSVVYAVGDSLLKVAEGVESFVNPAIAIIGQVREWVQENGYLVAGLALVGVGLAVAGTALVVFGTIAVGVSFVIGGLTSAWVAFGVVLAFVLSPMMLVVLGVVALAAALAALGYFWLTETKGGKKFADSMNTHVIGSLNNFKTAWAGVLAAIKSGDLGLAGKIAMLTLSVEIEKGLLAIISILFDFGAAFASVFTDVITFGFKQGLSHIVKVLEKLPDFITRNLNLDALKAAANNNDPLQVNNIQAAVKAAALAPLEKNLNLAQGLLGILIGEAKAANELVDPKLPKGDRAGLATGALGTFATGGVAGQIFGAGASISKQQLAVMKDMLDALAAANVALDKLGRKVLVMAP